jgi:hypothetical protein
MEGLINTHSRIPLNEHPQDWTSARLSNIPGHQIECILTSVLAHNFLLVPSHNMQLSITSI